MSADSLRRSVIDQIGEDDVRGAFPVVMAPTWRHVLADLTGAQRLIPGKPLIVAVVADELWVFSSSPHPSVGSLLAVFGGNEVSPIESVIAPNFHAGRHRLQTTVEWFDDARIALGRLRQSV